MATVVEEGKYIYCIAELNQAQSFGALGIGGRGDELHTICFKDTAAVVSNSPIKKYPVSRENLIPHERAIEEVMKCYTVLPVRFATIAKNEEIVKKILEREYDKFAGLLKEFKDKKELGLKAVFKEDVIYKDILEKYEDIKKLKEALTSRSFQETYYQRAKLGEMVANALQKEKETYKKDILYVLSPMAVEVKVNSAYGDMIIINAAFLVEKHRETEFDRKVEELEAKHGAKMRFKYVGTLPPFNFINIVIKACDTII